MRIWIYQTLKLSGLWGPAGGRVYQGSRMRQQPDKKPYAVYRLGSGVKQLHSSGPALRTPFQVFVYDVPGDYLQIDSLLEAARSALTTSPPLVVDVRYIDCSFEGYSGDVPEDPALGTIAKFAQFTLIHK